MVMEAVLYSTFRNHLKDYMKKVNEEFEPLTVVNKNPDEDIVVLSKSEWDSIQETLRIAQNKELSDKVLRGISQVRLEVLRSMLLRSEKCCSSLQKMPGQIIAIGKLRIRRH